MELGIKKCGVLEMRKGVLEKCDDIELPNDEVTQEAKDNGYEYKELVS